VCGSQEGTLQPVCWARPNNFVCCTGQTLYLRLFLPWRKNRTALRERKQSSTIKNHAVKTFLGFGLQEFFSAKLIPQLLAEKCRKINHMIKPNGTSS
jgi:hypothetical protein